MGREIIQTLISKLFLIIKNNGGIGKENRALDLLLPAKFDVPLAKSQRRIYLEIVGFFILLGKRRLEPTPSPRANVVIFLYFKWID